MNRSCGFQLCVHDRKVRWRGAVSRFRSPPSSDCLPPRRPRTPAIGSAPGRRARNRPGAETFRCRSACRNLWKQTIRQTARLSIGGSRVRIVLSNEYGKTPLTIGAANIALAGDGGKIKDGIRPCA